MVPALQRKALETCVGHGLNLSEQLPSTVLGVPERPVTWLPLLIAFAKVAWKPRFPRSVIE